MEDISKVGVERYSASNFVNPTSSNILLKTLILTFKSIYLLIYGLVSYLWVLLVDNEQRRGKKLENQVVLVTGGGNGFGRALCLELANEEKCHVAVVDLDYEAAKVTSNVVRSMGQKSFAYKVDVSNYDEVEQLYDKVKADLGTVDILINNAGVIPLMSFRERKPEDVERILDVNLKAHFWTTRLFINDMIEKKRGHIVGVSSGFGLYPGGRSVAYTASKFGVRGMMMALNEELCYNKMLKKYNKTTTIYPLAMATRSELVGIWKKLRLDSIYPVLSPEWCAKVAVEGIKNNIEHVTIPKNLTVILSIFSLFPTIIREKVVLGLYGGKIPQVYPEQN